MKKYGLFTLVALSTIIMYALSSANAEPNMAANNGLQILTTARILSVPRDWRGLKELFPEKKFNSFTPEKLEEFLKVVKADASVKLLTAPKVTTRDGEDAVIKISKSTAWSSDVEDVNKIDSIEFKIKNNIQPDRKSINAVFELKYACGCLQKKSGEVEMFLPSNYAIVVRGGEPCDGNEIILIVQPKVVEAGNVSQQAGVVESAAAVAASNENFNVLDVNFEPIRQGKNILWLTVRNKSDKEQFFSVNVYSRSVDYGSDGVGWGTNYYDKFDAGQTRKIRYVYKIHGPITDNTYTRLYFYNVNSLKHDENKDIQPFAKKQYFVNDLKVYPADRMQFMAASQGQFNTVSKILVEFQGYIRGGEYEKAWAMFSDDCQNAEYPVKGVEGFKRQMEPKHPLDSAFWWEKQDFLKLKPASAYIDNDKVVLAASNDNSQWKIDFVQQAGQWKIDWIGGYTPKIIEMQEKK